MCNIGVSNSTEHSDTFIHMYNKNNEIEEFYNYSCCNSNKQMLGKIIIRIRLLHTKVVKRSRSYFSLLITDTSLGTQ